ncbi:helicase-exonuclease AddAB subunit AddB [Garciella nitratireducens]|uniref:DNA helicase/exodeoxyribonuclease V, subunit B n=1 Tax=Garciella nitratireducens DSM 15102 TaxID=1121911 RepID=A0A1T4MAK9_9FIRM|nr:helicase-exonuclease AddAB subunit AddB [Garciella nitratireducens]SJZ64043.1 DNA helicase/exodeoxyribonuclease V, subunit B [Garciella nitratireducens DSM 15102]
MVEYILGRAGRGKTKKVFEQIKECLEKTQREKLFLIVPEQFTLQTERDLLQYLKSPGIMRIEVLSFKRLAHNIFHEVGGITRVPIDQPGKIMMIRKIIEEIQDSLGIYQKTAIQQGFIEKYIELLSSLKKNNIFPENLEETLKVIKEGMMKEKLKDILLIYEKIMEKSMGIYMDGEDTMALFIEKIEKADSLKDTYIWIDGFHNFSNQSMQIIMKLMKLSPKVTLSLSLDLDPKARDRELFSLSDKIFTKLRQGAQSQGIKEKILDLNRQEQASICPEIKYLEKELYTYPYQKYNQDIHNIELFKASNLYNEIEYMAAKIIELVRERGYRWKDISIVCNDLETYGSILKRTLEQYQIPYFLDQKRSIMNNPIIEYVLSCLETIYRGYRYEDVSRLLKTGFTPLTIEECEKLEIYVLQYGIKGKKWKSPFTLGKEEDLEQLNKIRKKLIPPLIDIEKKLKGKHSIEKISKVLYQHLENIEIREKLEHWIDILRSQGLYEYVNENTQIWNILMDTLDQLVEIIGKQEVTLKEYYKILQSGFSCYEIGIIPTTLDQVLVGELQRSKSHHIKALFVVGVNDGVLPSGLEDKDILSNDEKIRLQQFGIELGSDYDTRSQQERYFIYSSLSKPQEYLWLSYSLADGEGKALRPSSLIDRIKKIFPKMQEESDLAKDLEQQKKLISVPYSTFKHLVENLRLKADGIPIEEIWEEVYEWYYEQPQWTNLRENIIEGLFHNNQVSYVGRNQAKKLYHYPVRSSVSRLEGYVRCPFAHFIKYGLKPKILKEYKVESPDIGEIFHNSISLFTKELSKNKLDWSQIDRQTSEEMIEKIIDEIIPQYGDGVFQSTYRYQYLVKRLKRVSKRAIWTLTSHFQKGDFKLLGHEIIFGREGQFPAIEIQLSDGSKVYLEGRIDRVDILQGEEEDYVKIIDYKSGNKDLSLSDIYYGLNLQLIVYLGALLEQDYFSGKKPLKPAGVFYFKIDDPLIKSDEKIIEKVEQEIAKKLKLKGLVLEDINIVRAMDREINQQSSVLPVQLTKENGFYKTSSVLEEEGFFELLQYVRGFIQQISEEMLKGNIKIHPVREGKDTACNNCSYQAICQFDTLFQDNEYHNIQKLSDEEVLEKIKKEQEVLANG